MSCKSSNCACQAKIKQAYVGEPAPNFTAEACSGNGETFTKISLSDYKDKWVILFFYPLDFTFICPTEIKGFSERLPEITKLNAIILGVSTDSVHSHKAWINGSLGKLNFPLLADMTKQISEEYGVLIKKEGIALRGTFIIDPNGILKYSVISDNNVGRNADEIIRVLQALQTGDLCQLNWSPGEKTLGKT